MTESVAEDENEAGDLLDEVAGHHVTEAANDDYDGGVKEEGKDRVHEHDDDEGEDLSAI